MSNRNVLSIGGIVRLVLIDYVNYEGRRSWRRIRPESLYWGSNAWHPQPQFFAGGLGFG